MKGRWVARCAVSTALPALIILSLTGTVFAEADVTIMYNPVEQAFMDPAVKLFMRSNPGIEVKAIASPGFEEDKQKTMLVAGTAPDLLMLFTTEVPLYASQGWVVPIDLRHYYPAVIGGGRYKGMLYGLPIDEPGVMAAYYNEELFQQGGLAYPDSKWTWNDFLDYSRKLTIRQGNEVRQYGTSVSTYWGWYLPWIWQNGGRTLNESKTETTWGATRTVQALAFMNSLHREWDVATLSDATDKFYQGQLGILIDGVWRMDGLVAQVSAGNAIDWDVTKLPMQERQATYSAIRLFGVNREAKNREAAIKLLKFLAGPETQMLRARERQIPTVRDPQIVATALEGLPAGTIHLFESYDLAEWEWIHPYWPTVKDGYEAEISAMFAGRQSPAQTAERMNAKGNAALSGY